MSITQKKVELVYLLFFISSTFIYIAMYSYETVDNANLKKENEILQKTVATNHIDPLYVFNKQKMQDLIKSNFWSHNNSNGDTYSKRVNDSLVDGAIGEVLAKNYCSIEEAFIAWKDSPSHQAIISDRSYNRAIITFTKETDGTCYWVGTYNKAPIGEVIGVTEQ